MNNMVGIRHNQGRIIVRPLLTLPLVSFATLIVNQGMSFWFGCC